LTEGMAEEIRTRFMKFYGMLWFRGSFLIQGERAGSEREQKWLAMA